MASKVLALSRNAARKQKYATLAAEGQDKSARNVAIESALGEGAANLVAHDKVDGFRRVLVGYEDGGPVYAKVRNVVEFKAIVEPAMPTAPKPGSRAAKRAALKARRVSRLRDRTRHATGLVRCGNVGCGRCRPETPRHA